MFLRYKLINRAPLAQSSERFGTLPVISAAVYLTIGLINHKKNAEIAIRDVYFGAIKLQTKDIVFNKNCTFDHPNELRFNRHLSKLLANIGAHYTQW
jgi:hypothetical protein